MPVGCAARRRCGMLPGNGQGARRMFRNRRTARAWLAATLLACLAGPALAAEGSCEGLPWRFGMTPGQVRAVEACGPYQAFSNGDLETYAGRFDGKPQNVQFFFTHGVLRRIGIYTHEGQDAAAASVAFLALYRAVTRLYGPVETPGYAPPASDDAQGERAFTAAVDTLLAREGKVQMAPLRQPSDTFVFSSLRTAQVQGDTWYYVTLYLDAPRTPAPPDRGAATTPAAATP